MSTEQAERAKRIESNIGLVHACAARFRGRGAEYDDLFQAGCVGLCKAADGFDASRGFAFSTYAVPLILGEIRRVFREGGSVKVGRSVKAKMCRLLQIRQELENKLQREPTLSELSAEAGVDPAQIAFLLGAALPAISLSGDTQTNDRPPEIPVPPPDADVDAHCSLCCALDTLDARERRLIELRFFQNKTQAVTAEALGVSQVQVSRKERAILQRLRALLTDG